MGEGWPKPLNDWREFVGEVAIIVIGVLIALSAEELVSRVHERGLGTETRASLQDEISQNLGRLANRQSKAGCLHRRLSEVGALLSTARAGEPIAEVHWIGRPPISAVQNARWQAALNGGRVALLRNEEQSDFADMYTSLERFQEAEQLEQQAWAKLRGIAGLMELAPARDAALSDALQEARYYAWWLGLMAEEAQAVGEQLGVRASGVAPTRSSLCIPMNTSVENALKLVNRPEAGEPL
jgi:hypothetical protein